MTLPLIQTCHVIDDCSPGTSHFVVVAAVNAARGLVARSQQYTVQTSAPVTQPALQLRCVCLIGHCRITSGLFFEASLGAHSFICKSIFIHMKTPLSILCTALFPVQIKDIFRAICILACVADETKPQYSPSANQRPKACSAPRVLPVLSIIGSNWLLHMVVLSCTVIGRVDVVEPWLRSR